MRFSFVASCSYLPYQKTFRQHNFWAKHSIGNLMFRCSSCSFMFTHEGTRTDKCRSTNVDVFHPYIHAQLKPPPLPSPSSSLLTFSPLGGPTLGATVPWAHCSACWLTEWMWRRGVWFLRLFSSSFSTSRVPVALLGFSSVEIRSHDSIPPTSLCSPATTLAVQYSGVLLLPYFPRLQFQH